MRINRVLYFLILLTTSPHLLAQVSALEKAALNTLYNETNGAQWTSETDANPNNDWDFNGQVTSAWHGVTVSNGHVTQLDLRSNNLAGILGQTIGDLTYLTRVLLFDNQLTGTIPESLTGLSNLTYLSLSSNEFSGSIPDNVSGLTNLNTLFLGGNLLTGAVPDLSNIVFLNTLSITVNSFHFGDFEDQFNRFTGFSDFRYNIQAKVDKIDNLTVGIGSSIMLTTSVRGTQNHYQWYKDGVLINNAPDSPTLILTDVQEEDAGIYHATVTSDIVSGLTLVRNDINLNVICQTSPTADELPDVTECESFTLPSLSQNNEYYSESNATGVQMFPGDVISESQTVYIYVGNGGCFDESSFAITIDQLIMADSLEDVSACDSFTLPALNAGHYFTQSNGTGIEMFPGDILTSSRTIYIYLQSGSCSDEKSFALDVSPTHCPPTPNNEKMIFPKFFTPNNDGINDSWGGTPAENEIRGNVHIFDRLGKLLIKMDINSSSWDGTYKGREMPSSDYWYRFIDSQTGGVITGHFTLKR